MAKNTNGPACDGAVVNWDVSLLADAQRNSKDQQAVQTDPDIPAVEIAANGRGNFFVSCRPEPWGWDTSRECLTVRSAEKYADVLNRRIDAHLADEARRAAKRRDARLAERNEHLAHLLGRLDG